MALVAAVSGLVNGAGSADAAAQTYKKAASMYVGAQSSLHVEYAARGNEYGIPFTFTLFMNALPLNMYVSMSVNQAEHGIHIFEVAPQEYVKIYPTRRQVTFNVLILVGGPRGGRLGSRQRSGQRGRRRSESRRTEAGRHPRLGRPLRALGRPDDGCCAFPPGNVYMYLSFPLYVYMYIYYIYICVCVCVFVCVCVRACVCVYL